MKRIISLLVMLSIVLSLASCGMFNRISAPKINGKSLSKYTIVYDHEGLDYNKRAAEYIRDEIKERFSVELEIINDDDPKAKNEIVIGETSREISKELEADTQGLEFAIFAKDGSIALEGEYFVIAAAAYYFVETYASKSGLKSEISEEISIHEPIVKEAKNFIILIGDGMGVNHTKLFDALDDKSDYSDGEDLFYGYLLPYHGFSRTNSLSGVTDSAAGGTAISSGIKTLNGNVGQDKDGNDVQSLTELSATLGKGTAVMSTESNTGATPSSFSAHTSNRDNTQEIREDQLALFQTYGTVVECGFDYYTAKKISVIEDYITETLDKIDDEEDGFFLMYEEAHIDKHSHNNDAEKTYLAIIRFNQAIARFMEYAFYNPETFILITADHETGGLSIEQGGGAVYSTEEHTEANVPIFAYGDGAELFGGKTIENIQIAHTIATFLGVDDFGDQSTYGSLTE